MANVYIIDADALVYVPEICVSEKVTRHLFDAFTHLVRDGILVFPDAVLKDCKVLADGEMSAIWANAVSGSRQDYRAPSKFLEMAISTCPNIVDPDDPGDQSRVDVLSLSLHHRDQGKNVTIITEDLLDVGNRWCLKTACCDLRMPHRTLGKFLHSEGLTDFITPRSA